jgi:hypothetical protein
LVYPIDVNGAKMDVIIAKRTADKTMLRFNVFQLSAVRIYVDLK